MPELHCQKYTPPKERKKPLRARRKFICSQKSSKVKGMVFLKGKQGVCFDIPTASVTEVQEKWHDSQLAAFCATEQPELEGPWEGYCNFRGQ